MRKTGRLLWICSLSALVGSACSVTRHIPEGEYLLQRVRIENDRSTPRRERIPKEELEKYIRQQPNKRILGTNFYVWLYGQADSTKHNGWNNWKRRVGQEPVLLDMTYTRRSAQNLKVYMDSKGYYASEATFEVDTLSRRKRAKVTYRTRQGAPYRISQLGYDFRDPSLAPLVLADTVHTLLRPGDIFDITQLDAERERITAYLRNRGYYNFSAGNIEYIADTLGGDRRVGLTMVVKPRTTGFDADGRPVAEQNTVYRIGRINIFPDYDPTAAVLHPDSVQHRADTVTRYGINVIYNGRRNLRHAALRQAVTFRTDERYSPDEVNRTYADLMAFGFFRSARISFTEQPERITVTDTIRVIEPNGAEETTVRRTTEGVLDCNIYCTPTLKQSFKVELEGSTTSSFYGLKATVGYQNRNIFRGAESFDISFSGGYEFMKAKEAVMRRATEIGVKAGLTFPRFLIPGGDRRFRSVLQPKTKLETSVNFQNRPYYRRTLTSIGLGYQWSNRRYSNFVLRPIDINVVKVSRLDSAFLSQTQNKYLINSYKTQLIAGLSFSYAYNNQRRNLGGNATVVRFNVETAGNLLDGIEHLFSNPRSEGYYTLFGIRYSQYVRTDLSLSRKIMLGEKTAVAGRLYGGVAKAYGNSDAVPFDRLFYAGGSNSMRGWAPRTLGPGSVPDPHSDYPAQLGDMKLEANLELRFPIWGIVHGATFFDLGNIWYLKSDASEYAPEAVFHLRDFYKQLGFNTGLGLRFDIKFAVLRLDWGVQLHNPNRPEGHRWIRHFRWSNTAFNFGVGYPF